MQKTYFLLALVGLLLLGPGGCDSDDTTDSDAEANTVHSFCQTELKQSDVRDFLDGNLVIVGSYAEEGFDSAKLVSSLFLNIVLNGIDFSNLDNYDVSFDSTTGHYTLSDGDTHVGFSLYFAEDFEAFTAGEVIPHNIFSLSTFVTNIDVSVNTKLEYDYTYDKGPLFNLINGDVDVNASSLTNFDVSLSVKSTLISIGIDSEQTYPGSYPFNKDDLLTLKLASTQITLSQFVEQLNNEGLGINYAGTHYNSAYFGIQQTFADALFLITQTDGVWHWEGEYHSDVSKFGVTLYQSGFVSNIEANFTEYYCDKNVSNFVGTANHRLDLWGGEFTFSTGDSFGYGLAPY